MVVTLLTHPIFAKKSCDKRLQNENYYYAQKDIKKYP